MALTSRSIVWVDANGKNAITRIRTNGSAASIQAAILAASNGDYQTWWESAETSNGAPAPVAATYIPLQPMAQCQFICTDNTMATVLLPSPKLGIFRADAETIDPALIAALVTACIVTAPLVSASGSPAVALVSAKLLPYRGAA